jgi:Ca2+-binding RTX toxin-like protein
VIAINVGANILDGGGGDDLFLIYPGGGSYFLYGSDGNDTVSFVHQTAGINFTEGGTNNVTSVENVIGSNFNDTISLGGVAGAGIANHLQGLAGNDLLFGSGGGDILDGGDGNDTVWYGDAAVAVDLSLARGTGGIALGDTFISVENLNGGSGDDRLTGSGGDNRLDGGSGDDILTGGAGNDTVISGAGNDVLRGGDGADYPARFLRDGHSDRRRRR